MKKRILSCLMALALSLTLLPATAQAAEGESVTEPHTHSDWLASGYGTDGKTLVLRAGGDDNIYGDTLEKPNDGDWILPAGNYYLQDDITVEYAIAISGDVTICLNSKTIQSTGGDAVFRVTGSGKLTLTDCNGNAGKVKSTREGSGSGVKVENGGTFNMYGGAITKNTANKGGGVYVSGGNSKFNMYGGTITDNTATKGGGVYVSGGTFTMNGGTISGNNATDQNNGIGGGVYVVDGTFTMDGGTITKNTASSTDGGVGVYTSTSTATFTMNGGTISGNTATKGGGVGVYGTGSAFTVNGSAFIMNGGAISGNTATNNGGGVYVSKSGTFEMHNSASVTGNTASASGGGVYVNEGKFEMNDTSSITDNTATNNKPSDTTYGGGVYVNNSGTFTMNGNASIKSNTATNGGGVYVSGGTFTMNGGTSSVSKNTAKNGGGVSVSSGTFNMNDGTISGNTGNGVFVNGGTFTVSNTPTVKENTKDGAASNVCLAGGAYITIGKINPTDNASIGVTKTVDNGVFAKNVSTDCSGNFFSDDTPRHKVEYNKTTQQLVLTKSSAPAEHTHIWTYEANNATITATCTNTTGVCDVNHSFVRITPPDELIYNGKDKHATVKRSINWEPAFPKDIVISYYKLVGGSYEEMVNEAPKDVGKYKASITVGGKIAFVEYEITGSTTEIVPVSQITLNKMSTSISVGNSEKLTATVTPENAANKDLKWASSDTSVATVAADGTVTAVKAGTATITATAADGSGKSATCTVTVTGGTTPSQPGGSTGGNTGGSSSGGGGGSSSDRDSSDSNPVIKTETKNNADGSTTKTETRKDGTVTQTTTAKDGSTSKTETKKDGSSVTENKAADGSTGTVKTDKHGQTEAKTALSNKAIEDAKKNGEAVKVPVEVEASRNSSTAPTVKVELPKGTGETKVEIPVSNVKPGTVAVLVHPDGTEEILKNSIPTEDGIQLTVDGSATVKIIDNSKGFIDTQDHWAKDAIDFVSARGLVNGMTDTIYAPNNSTTRAQLWTILARQNDADLSGGSIWYEKAQNWAKDKGVSDGANPNAAINRAQMVTMLWRAVGQPTAGSTANFTDVPADTYYAGAVSWAVENGITTGVGNGKFNPAATCTRAQIAAFLTRLYAEK